MEFREPIMRRTLGLILIAMPLAYCDAASGATFLGPTPYLQFADSPFAGLTFDTFHLETFEDHLLNVPGVTASGGGVISVVFGPGLHDSVDADDGVIDGSGLGGDTYFQNEPETLTFAFDSNVLGSYPTHAGLVWTDGAVPPTSVTFEAFDANGVSLGMISGAHSDAVFNGTTGEDRFYGVIELGGISAITMGNLPSLFESDHLQYGIVPEPAAYFLGLVGLLLLARSRPMLPCLPA
jgi:hypothetical protein